jgi:hypothetical protein
MVAQKFIINLLFELAGPPITMVPAPVTDSLQIVLNNFERVIVNAWIDIRFYHLVNPFLKSYFIEKFASFLTERIFRQMTWVK